MYLLSPEEYNTEENC